MAETKHASWLASKGNKHVLNLYDACVSDLANALLQSAKMLAFVEGKYKGVEPSAEKLAKRVAQGKAPSTASLAREVEQNIQGTPRHMANQKRDKLNR